jgi:hypothetical protein
MSFLSAITVLPRLFFAFFQVSLPSYCTRSIVKEATINLGGKVGEFRTCPQKRHINAEIC